MSSDGSEGGSKKETEFGCGVLHVEICEARNIKGDEIFGFGKADPYVVLKYGTGTNAVTLTSSVHKNGGSSPIWNDLFKFPLRNGGTREHNNLEIEIWNQNRRMSSLRKDDKLGHLRIGGLAEFLKNHDYMTEPMWYPVIRTNGAQDSNVEEENGQIMIKFYFQTVEERFFAGGHHTRAGVEHIEAASDSGGHLYHADVSVPEVQLLNTVFAGVGAFFGGAALFVS